MGKHHFGSRLTPVIGLILLLAAGRAAVCAAAERTARPSLTPLSSHTGAGKLGGTGRRGIPVPLPGHPGNVFLAGEKVVVPLPDATSAWQLVDDDGNAVAVRIEGKKTANLGALPVGFYRLVRKDAPADADWVSLAVIERLRSPTPTTSPICVDSAMSWHNSKNKELVASLAALAGVNRIRDRFDWPSLEPEKDQFAKAGNYEESAKVQSDAGLQVLFVNHITPAWALSLPKGQKLSLRFPPDLRDAYSFYREMAKRFKGSVVSFEPWNESDLPTYGAHTGAERAAMQKASYLGLKAGNPEVTACLNPLAFHPRDQLDDFADNEVWPYFDTYNLHHYEGFGNYPRLYADHRGVSAGRPLWVSECTIFVIWKDKVGTPEPLAELNVQAERVAKVFACALHEGAAAVFYFMLGSLAEGDIQYGILRKDGTPRPGYVALAAAGRLLADAKPIGKIKAGSGVSAYAFRAKPDGKDAIAVVAWTDGNPAAGTLPLSGAAPMVVFDHLGRTRPAATNLTLTAAPIYVFFSPAAAEALALETPPSAPPLLEGKPVAVVLQPLWPYQDSLDRKNQSAYGVSASTPTGTTLVVYNFGAKPVSGSLRATPPNGWSVEGLDKPVKVEPMGRLEVPIRLLPSPAAAGAVDKVRFVGDFGPDGQAVASMRIAPHAN